MTDVPLSPLQHGIALNEPKKCKQIFASGFRELYLGILWCSYLPVPSILTLKRIACKVNAPSDGGPGEPRQEAVRDRHHQPGIGRYQRCCPATYATTFGLLRIPHFPLRSRGAGVYRIISTTPVPAPQHYTTAANIFYPRKENTLVGRLSANFKPGPNFPSQPVE